MTQPNPSRSKFDELRTHLDAGSSPFMDPMARELVDELEDITVRASRLAESERADLTQQVLREAFSR